MSSVYKILCLSHDPAIEIGIRWDDETNAAKALGKAQSMRDARELDGHEKCVLAVGRYSYPLVDISPVDHYDWIDAAMLRLVLHGLRLPANDPIGSLAREAASGFWSERNINRLARLLEGSS